MSAKHELKEIFTNILAEYGQYADDPAMEALESAISKMLSDGYVRKELYKEKLDLAAELKESLETALEGLSTAGEEATEYREKLALALESHRTYVESQSQATRMEKARAAAARQLEAYGADPRYVNLLMKELELGAAELCEDGDGNLTIANFDALAEPLKTALPEAFGVLRWSGARIAAPPETPANRANPWDKGSESLEGQTELYRKDPALARELARCAGIRLQ